MKIVVQVVDVSNQPLWSNECEINEFNLVQVAETRRPLLAHQGEESAANLVASMGRDLLAAFRQSALPDELVEAASNAALATWLYESQYCNLSETDFTDSDLVIVLLPGGAVRVDRVRKGAL